MNIEMYKQFFAVQQSHWWFAARKKIVLDAISRYCGPAVNGSILDVGCGCGVMLNSLQELGATSGLDMSDDAIDFCNEIFAGDVRKGWLPDNVPFVKNSFSLITALDVIEHIDDDEASLRVLHSLLDSNGIAVITVPAYKFLWSRFDDMNQHKRRYTLGDLEKKLIDANFTIEKISYFNSLLFPLVAITRLIGKITGRDGSTDVKLPGENINSFLRKVFELEVPILKKFNFPFGVSIIAIVRK